MNTAWDNSKILNNGQWQKTREYNEKVHLLWMNSTASHIASMEGAKQ